MSARYEPLKTTVSYFEDQYDKSTGDSDKYWLLGLRGLESMHYNISAEPKTVRLPVNANQTVNFPADYVDWVKVGILNNKGELNTLKINNALTKFKDNNPNRLSLLTPDITDTWLSNANPFYLNYFNNGIYGTLYGAGGGIVTYGECRIDDVNNIIILSPDFKYESVIFEYISSPEKDIDYMVDVRLREALIAFIAWKCNLDSRQNYYAALTESRRMIKPIRMQSFQQTIRENEKFCLKT